MKKIESLNDIEELRSKREKAKNKTFTMYPSTFEMLKMVAAVCKVNNSEMLEILIKDEFKRYQEGE